MVVEVYNITDGPEQDPQQIEIYSKTLAPGESIKIPAELVDERLRQLAEGDRPKIAIGQAPSWYLASKIRRGKELTAEEVQRRYSSRVKKAETKTALPKILPKIEDKKELKEEPKTLMFSDSIGVEDDLTPFERKTHKKKG